MLLLISDANVLIDFEEGGIIASLFAVPELTLLVPDVLYEEELRHRQAPLVVLGLQVRAVEPVGVARAAGLAAKHRRASRNDLLALALAEQESCPLATGDRHLRDAAAAEGVQVRGTLWLAEQLVRTGTVTPDAMRDAYARMRAALRRLPWADVDTQLIALGSSPL